MARAWLVALIVCVISLAAACRHRATPDSPIEDILPSGEPETYSATVVHILDDGTPHEASVSRVVRSGEMLRQEWDEQGEPRAVIWRPDLGKLFLLSLNRKEFVEMALGPQAVNASPAAAHAPAGSQQNEANASRDSVSSTTPDAIDRAMSDAQEPASVETHILPDTTIDNHPCQVVEQRARFADGHTETTRTARARDLGGLELRIEIVPDAQSGSVKVITERRAIRTEVSPDEFNVPADFKHKNR
jgi:hypothetical protein